jgi:hypothetical protein
MSQFEIRSDKKYFDIKENFEKHFKSKNIGSTFNNDAWFLREDIEFQKVLKPTVSTPYIYKPMHNLLKETSTSDDIKKFEINVDKFIENLTIRLLQIKQQLDYSDQLIKKYKASENKNKIDAIIDILKNNINNSSQDIGSSTLQMSIGRLENFPEGGFLFKFHMTRFLTNNSAIRTSENITIKNNKILNIKEGKQMIIFKGQTNQPIFDPIKFYPIELDERNENKLNDFSGTDLIDFNLFVQRDNEDFAESQTERFLDLFLSTESFYDTTVDNVNLFYTFNLETQKRMLRKYKDLAPNYDLVLEMNFKLDQETRISILKRLKSIFSNVIANRFQNKQDIEELLDYFPEIKEKVLNILYSIKEDRVDTCASCNSCNIF